MIKVLVTGSAGQVAMSLLDRAVFYSSIEVVAIGRPALDLERPEGVLSILSLCKPDLIVNAAAYTAVDHAETEERLAVAVNRDGAVAVAAAAQLLGVPLIHLSTDYVYDGLKGLPYVESDPTTPLNVYGRSKLAGEQAVRMACPDALILRTAWVYSPFGRNFVKTMLRLGAERPVLRVVDDQWGNPTSAFDLADAVLRMVPAFKTGTGQGRILHVAGSGHTTWCRFAREIFRLTSESGGRAPEIEAIATSDYPTPARRPANTSLNLAALEGIFDISTPAWAVGLHRVIARLKDHSRVQ